MSKPEKPNVIIPKEFAINGDKVDFAENKIQNGFDKINADVLAGDNLNKFIDDTYKVSNYALKLGDYIDEVKTNIDDKVSKSGDTMTGNLTIQKTTPMILMNTTSTSPNAGSVKITSNWLDSNNVTGLSSNATVGNLGFYDKNNVYTGLIQQMVNTDGTIRTFMNAHRIVNGVEKEARVECFVTKDGTSYVTAPTPAVNDNSTKIATTNFVNKAVDGQWVNKEQMIVSGLSMAPGDVKYYSLADYLPNDGYMYEVMLMAGGRAPASGNSVQLWIGGTTVTSWAGYVVNRASSYSVAGGSVIAPIGTDRRMVVASWNQSGTSEGVSVQMRGYRRIGNNK